MNEWGGHNHDPKLDKVHTHGAHGPYLANSGPEVSHPPFLQANILLRSDPWIWAGALTGK